MTPHDSKTLFELYRSGHDEAATAIFDRHAEKLLALARVRIFPKLRRKIDPDDVVQSAYRSFFVGARKDRYDVTRSGDLWRLLAGITLKKLYGQVEKLTAERRAPDKELATESAIEKLAADDPMPIEAIVVAEQLSLALKNLPEDARAVLALAIDGQSIDEICKSMGKSARTIRRILANTERQITRRILGYESSKLDHSVNRTTVVETACTLNFGDFILQKLIGVGGMGKVFRGIDKRTGDVVAIKSLHKSWQTDERAVDQFVQEAQILSQLRHDNIVGVHGLGQYPGGGLFIVMDFIDGFDLQSRLASGRLTVIDAVRTVGQVAEAVQHAHEHGIVHCDLKPGNILQDQTNRVFVTDFGFAQILAANSVVTMRRLGGTIGYIAPEVLYSRAPPTPAADIYALGALLWVLVTGRKPEREHLLNEVNGERKGIAAICSRCLEDDPRRRYPSAADVIGALSDLASRSGM